MEMETRKLAEILEFTFITSKYKYLIILKPTTSNLFSIDFIQFMERTMLNEPWKFSKEVVLA